MNDSDLSPAEWRYEELRATLSTWLTVALSIGTDNVTVVDLLNLRDWIDNGCPGEAPMPTG